MINNSGKKLALKMKRFLELVQPLPVKHGYPRGIKSGEAFVSYQEMSTTPTIGIGNRIISETRLYTITVQTKTAEQNLLYTDLIKYGTQETDVMLASTDLRKDPLVQDGWINTIIVRVYNGFSLEQVVFTVEEVRNILQEIADRYLFVTSIYGIDIEDSFIDRMVVSDLEDKDYSYEELVALKKQYLDKLIFTTTEF